MGEVVIRVPIGFDDENDHVYSVFIALCSIPGYGDGAKLELIFRVIEASTDGSYIYDYSDGLTTRAFLADGFHRHCVSRVLLAAVDELIDYCKPLAVEMTTHTEDLPGKALRKFHEIAARFADKGYEVAKPDPWHGRWIWMMRLPDGTA